MNLTCSHNSKVHAHDFHTYFFSPYLSSELLIPISSSPFLPQSLLLLSHSLSLLVASPSLSIYVYYTVGYLRTDFNQKPDSSPSLLLSPSSIPLSKSLSYVCSLGYLVLNILPMVSQQLFCFSPDTFKSIFPTDIWVIFPKYKSHHAISLFKTIQRLPIASG